MTSIVIERDICHQCELSKPYKELATFKDSEGRTNYFSPIICVGCHNKKDFIEWKKVINNKGNEVNIYSCNCPKCKVKNKL
ncbi:MAG: hypothetical protein I3273_06135 [Candidatus Moeniiplasma glomeromycotorum]|nr:hypothetical protein [Candidatus Moeniiplasma glomeromycotorum]MCE8162367.1 hypothetical protein [Candidatus Moeniiplasma glomeromycotorum]MCE8163812.1 hypothetical protein [Candidatus Moeniiplasma glomeromycotorum]MCE8166291.1 hypothetical protein [Candidatus Moeniiplasma glomeromycotorum]MCE8166773.1 hypothetical protein [Candidatus Moeniiplasma glomeromycotorum]